MTRNSRSLFRRVRQGRGLADFLPGQLDVRPGGNLWIATDGAPETLGFHDGFFATPVEGTRRGRLKAFLTVPVGAEATGPAMSEDDRSIFVAVQHPGEGGSYDEPTST